MVNRLDVDKLLGDYPSRFEPKPFYLADADALCFYAEDTECFAERIDCWLTIYKSFEDQRLIGFKIKNVKVLLSRFDALGFQYRASGQSWSIQLQPILAYIPLAVQPEPEQAPEYRSVLMSFGDRLSQPVELVGSH